MAANVVRQLRNGRSAEIDTSRGVRAYFFAEEGADMPGTVQSVRV